MAGLSREEINYYQLLKTLEEPTVVQKCGSKGRGLFTCVDLEKDDYIIEYVGEEYLQRDSIYKSRGYKHDYFQPIKNNMILDAQMVGNNGRYANHSCTPNSSVVRVQIKQSGVYVAFIAARKKIKRAEEITMDYKWYKSTTEAINLSECLCGSPNCRGFM